MWNPWHNIVGIIWIFASSYSLESAHAWSNCHISSFGSSRVSTDNYNAYQEDSCKLLDRMILSASISSKALDLESNTEMDATNKRSTIRIRQDKESVKSFESMKNDVGVLNEHRRKKKSKRSSFKTSASWDLEFLIKRTDQLVYKHDKFASLSSSSSIYILRSVHWLMDAWIQLNTDMDTNKNKNRIVKNVKTSTMNTGNTKPSPGKESDAHSSSTLLTTYQVQRLFDALQKQYDIQPTDKTWSRLIKAYGQERGGESAMSILNQVPLSIRNVHNYAEALDSWALEIMMKQKGRSRVAATAVTSSPVAPEYSKARVAQDMLQQMIMDENLPAPNPRCFHAVIRAWGHECNPPAAQATLSLMQTLHSQGRIEEAPNRFCFNAVIYAWTNTGYEWHAEMAEELVNEMLRSDTVRPNIVSYNLCIAAWAKVGNGERAEAVLRKMNLLASEDASLQPTTLTYNTVMNAYAKSPDADAAEKAEKILLELKKRVKDEGMGCRVRPDIFSYSTSINAWARSLDGQKLDRVLNIYEELNQDDNIRPNVVIFNAILNACAYTYGDIFLQRKAMETATTIFRHLDESKDASPDHITYGTFLKVCQNQMIAGETQNQIVRVIFMKCVKDGMVSQFVLDQMKSFPGLWQWIQDQSLVLVGKDTETTVSTIAEDDKSRVGMINDWMDIPPSWRRNVVQGKRKRR